MKSLYETKQFQFVTLHQCRDKTSILMRAIRGLVLLRRWTELLHRQDDHVVSQYPWQHLRHFRRDHGAPLEQSIQMAQ
jgi:hypothetical protein